MQIDWTLLLLLVVAALGVLGLVLALQTAGGRRRLADAAMALAEALLHYAVEWLERDLPAHAVIGAKTTCEICGEEQIFYTQTDRARAALGALRG